MANPERPIIAKAEISLVSPYQSYFLAADSIRPSLSIAGQSVAASLQLGPAAFQGTMRRDEQLIESELIEIMAIQDDTVKLERIVAWCAAYPDEIPFALRFFRNRAISAANDSSESRRP